MFCCKNALDTNAKIEVKPQTVTGRISRIIVQEYLYGGRCLSLNLRLQGTFPSNPSFTILSLPIPSMTEV